MRDAAKQFLQTYNAQDKEKTAQFVDNPAYQAFLELQERIHALQQTDAHSATQDGEPV